MEIEKGIPIQPSHKSKFPFGQMEVGDSFLCEMTPRAASYAYGKAHGMKFTTHKTPEGFRCWRIA